MPERMNVQLGVSSISKHPLALLLCQDPGQLGSLLPSRVALNYVGYHGEWVDH